MIPGLLLCINAVLPSMASRLVNKDGVGPVCRRFQQICDAPTLWRNIEISNNVPTDTLITWIQAATQLKTFCMGGRNDANVILDAISRNCKSLKTIEINGCWGCSTNPLLVSKPLCSLVIRCREIEKISLHNVRFFSRKFCKLLAGTNICGRLSKWTPFEGYSITDLRTGKIDYE